MQTAFSVFSDEFAVCVPELNCLMVDDVEEVAVAIMEDIAVRDILGMCNFLILSSGF